MKRPLRVEELPVNPVSVELCEAVIDLATEIRASLEETLAIYQQEERGCD